MINFKFVIARPVREDFSEELFRQIWSRMNLWDMRLRKAAWLHSPEDKVGRRVDPRKAAKPRFRDYWRTQKLAQRKISGFAAEIDLGNRHPAALPILWGAKKHTMTDANLRKSAWVFYKTRPWKGEPVGTKIVLKPKTGGRKIEVAERPAHAPAIQRGLRTTENKIELDVREIVGDLHDVLWNDILGI